ncbi:MAG TPA: DUF3048 domain-containing protein [Chloroflexota bacterium]|nr:DUF3048 domain-containing protein [Chloroflexota bacterium]
MLRSLLAVAGCALVLLTAGCGGSTQTVSTTVGAKSIPSVKLPPYVPGPLDGQSTPRSRAMRRPLAVMVENYYPDSRPQTGLGAASTVIETLAEGGITRFMAIYLEHDAPKIGPVRSTRIYFDHWAASFHAILDHVGGNDDAQAHLRALSDVFNVDENYWEVSLTNTGTPLFWRSADRVPPHNMYTSTYKVRAYAAKHHQDWAYTNAYLPHKHPAAKHGHHGTITINFQDPLNPAPQPPYDVQYRYDLRTNTYLRFIGGAPHIDAATGKQLAPSNVVVMEIGNGVADPAAGPTIGSITLPVVGSGPAFFFLDGRVLMGRWSLPNENAPLRFYDRHGRLVAFNPGQTWIEAVPPSSPWSYK